MVASPQERLKTMAPSPYRFTLFALYQFSLLLGIALLPVAIVARRAGIDLPIHRVVSRLGAAYERAAGN
jgi:hypothetical protein